LGAWGGQGGAEGRGQPVTFSPWGGRPLCGLFLGDAFFLGGGLFAGKRRFFSPGYKKKKFRFFHWDRGGTVGGGPRWPFFFARAGAVAGSKPLK